MKKILFCLVLFSGCCNGPHYSQEFKNEVSRNAERYRVYAGMMKEGKTKPQQDKAFISANESAWKTLEEIVNK